MDEQLIIPPLKPCPFCGNKTLYWGATTAVTFGVRCMAGWDGCGAELSVEMPDKTPEFLEDCTPEEFSKACVIEAIKLWNKREHA